MRPIQTRATSPALLVGVLSGGVFLATTAGFMLGPILVQLANDFDTSLAVTGQLVGATFATWGLMAVLAGPVSDTIGRRRVLLTGTILVGVGVLGSAFAPNYPTLLALRLLTGAGGGMVPPVTMATAADRFPLQQRGRVIGILFFSNWMGAVAGVAAVALLSDLGGWRLPFFAVGAPLVALWGLMWLRLPASRVQPGQPVVFLPRMKEVLRVGRIRAILTTMVCQEAALNGILTYLPVFLIQTYGMDEGATALPLLLAGSGTMAGSLAGGFVAGRPRRLLIVFGGVAVSSGGAGLLFATSVAVPLTVVLGFGVMAQLAMAIPVYMTLLTELAGRSRATATGMMSASNQFGGVAGASIGALVLSAGGFAPLGLFYFGAAILAATVTRLWVRDSEEFRRMVKKRHAHS